MIFTSDVLVATVFHRIFGALRTPASRGTQRPWHSSAVRAGAARAASAERQTPEAADSKDQAARR